jgi:hypothetical protein
LAALAALAGLAHEEVVAEFGLARLARREALLVAAAQKLIGGKARPG